MSSVLIQTLLTFYETIAYHFWIYLFPRAFVHLIPDDVFSKQLTTVLAFVVAHCIWYKYLSSGFPKEVEIALRRSLLLSQKPENIMNFLVESSAIFAGLSIFNRIWTDYIPYTLTLPDLRSGQSGNRIKAGISRGTISAVATEFLLSGIHYWGVSILQQSPGTNMFVFRATCTSLAAAVGKIAAKGPPSLNSSIATLAAIRNPDRRPELLLLAITDVLASICVAWWFDVAKQPREKQLRQAPSNESVTEMRQTSKRDSVIRKSRDIPLLEPKDTTE